MQSKAYPTREGLSRLKRQLSDLGITHLRVAEAASKTSRRGSVKIATVSLVFSDKRKSANVVDTAKRLIAAARQAEAVPA